MQSSKGRLHCKSSHGYFHLYNQDRSIAVRLRQRQQLPATYCRSLNEHSFAFGYGTSDDKLDTEFLTVKLSDDGSLEINRDTYCTLPLYYSFSRGRLVISNLYGVVTGQRQSLTPDPYAINIHLTGGELRGRRTLYTEVNTLEERSSLTLKHGKLQHTPGEARKWRLSLEAPSTDPHQFIGRLEASFQRFIHNRLSGNRTAFEISGGLDSSTLPLYLGKIYPGTPLLGFAMRFNGSYFHTQGRKLDLLRSAAHMRIIEQGLEIGHNSPLERVIQGENLVMQPLANPIETYHEPTDYFARLLHQEGIDTVVTGIGGDELFEHIANANQHLGIGEETYQGYVHQMPPYMTRLHSDTVKAALNLQGMHLPMLSIVLHTASVNRNNTYIEHGIWPITPFSDPYLVRFCQGLPSHFKANKNIMRAFYQAHRFPEEIYNPVQNEDFESFFNGTFYRHVLDNLFEHLLSRSYTVDRGYISAQQLQATYEEALRTRNSQWLYHLYCWMCTEIDLAYHRDKLAPVPAYS